MEEGGRNGGRGERMWRRRGEGKNMEEKRRRKKCGGEEEKEKIWIRGEGKNVEEGDR